MSGVFLDWLENHHACSILFFFLHSDLLSEIANFSPKWNGDSKKMGLHTTKTTAIEINFIAPRGSCWIPTLVCVWYLICKIQDSSPRTPPIASEERGVPLTGSSELVPHRNCLLLHWLQRQDFTGYVISYHLFITSYYLTLWYSHQNITSGIKQFSSTAAANLNLETDVFLPENSFFFFFLEHACSNYFFYFIISH